LELPLDHFRLIGVSPSATSEEILRAFQLRLDKTPDEGFTYEVLTQRSELLRLTADLLTDPDSRREYENLLLNGSSGLDFSSNREVAGLLLLWGGKDPWMNTPKKRNLYKKFTPKNTKEIILDAGHCPHDEIPELVNQHILDWVDSL